jgi:hypothetical protein
VFQNNCIPGEENLPQGVVRLKKKEDKSDTRNRGIPVSVIIKIKLRHKKLGAGGLHLKS